MNLSDVVSRRLSDIPRVSTVTGYFVGMVDGLAQVNVQGATVSVRCDGWNPPTPGMPVRVETLNGLMRVTGPSQTLPARGTVVESREGDTRALVDAGGDEYDLPVMAPYVPLPGDVVVLNWQSGHVLGEEAAAPDDQPPPTVGGGSNPFSGLLVQAQSSGKYDFPNGNWWGNGDVRASNNNAGAWFYHGAFTALAGADVSSIELHLPTPWRAVGALFVGLHPHATRPGGAPSIGTLTTVSARSGWVSLPAGWGNFLRDNPNHGIGVTSGAGDNQWPGVPQDGYSGALRFAGTR